MDDVTFFRDGVECQKVSEAVEKSAKEERWVKIQCNVENRKTASDTD